ncbi:mediator of RNA polymerase II transcription subunit 7-like X4 [Biomphalaria glabrata]|nr:Biomphalaria glabrata mediator of RNA polymerase II transcription subunit 7-like; transcript variant X4 [Biomphalaria glabrata]KAI8757607.1 Biomphalaria glabrata mediator of RNA polymerase II transcription subunit 7-like; transcript variant X4 [Biomphalaria glabrata]
MERSAKAQDRSEWRDVLKHRIRMERCAKAQVRSEWRDVLKHRIDQNEDVLKTGYIRMERCAKDRIRQNGEMC